MRVSLKQEEGGSLPQLANGNIYPTPFITLYTSVCFSHPCFAPVLFLWKVFLDRVWDFSDDLVR